jgi:glycosyltransferase involved in cell wall biosynthesis
MTEPLVCAIMLTRDRPEMAARAVRSFRAQTYELRMLLVYDSSAVLHPELIGDSELVEIYNPTPNDGRSVGSLRNDAARMVPSGTIIIHWDDDDYSHPNRIAEQVALLQSEGPAESWSEDHPETPKRYLPGEVVRRPLEAVGYREMLFWREQAQETWRFHNPEPQYCLGTSLCYWRSTWQKRPFPDYPKGQGPVRSGRGEDTDWLRDPKTLQYVVRSKGVTSFAQTGPAHREGDYAIVPSEPRMIASIHAGNAIHYTEVGRNPGAWTRVPEWDDYCKGRMAL